MAFWNLSSIELAEFRPGILSKAEIGADLIMACMEIGPGKEDTGHEHPFDQGGVILEGQIEMFIGEERKRLGPNDAYFIPAGVWHGWKTFERPTRILDVSPKQK
jgi:mannose-6-phosphate isomerase-like protein (cupin superfamily)